MNNTIYIKDTIVSFCYNFLKGLKEIEIDNNYKGLMMNLDDHYSFRYYFENDFLLVVDDDKVYKYDFKPFYQSLKKFWKKVSLDLVFFYPELKENRHFQAIQKELTGI
ncbi:hypothetical protein QNI19_31360 [Cytophagaceae bacterium DM2B3-1]|uniref:Uncharacterized protein n=1 Tax=Xanthocytophaga flava TaxID=3048013 RepID=A0ABT7CUN8_9BACT|nr:hypothetical protein [Xanthocytophaga flavus]